MNHCVRYPSFADYLCDLQIGSLMPISSNFFISWIVLRTLFTTPLRLFLPHAGVRFFLLRWVLGAGNCGGVGDAGVARLQAALPLLAGAFVDSG